MGTKTVTSRLPAYFLSLLLLALIAAAPRAEASSERKMTTAESFVPMKPMTITIIQRQQIVGNLVVQVNLDIQDATVRSHLVSRLPALRDAYVRALTEYAATGLHADRPADIDAIIIRLQRATDHLTGRGEADVLISQAMVRTN